MNSQGKIKLLYNGISSCVLNHGYTTKYFPIKCGVRQGCPISALLFIIVAETLSIAIKRSKNVKGIKVNTSEYKITQLADDTTLFLKDIQSLHHALNILYTFKIASNLKLNYGKTQVLPVGNISFDNNTFKLKWVKERVYALGTWFYKDTVKGNHYNHEQKLQSVKAILDNCKKLHLTWYGKIQAVKSLAISKILFSLSSLSTPEWFVKEVQKEINTFLWDGKPPRIKFSAAINDYEWGGLRLPHIESIVFASKAMWIKRLWNKNAPLDFFAQQLPDMDFKDFIQCEIDPETLSHSIPTFYRQVLYAWFTIKPKLRKHKLPYTIIWLNKNIRVNGKAIFYKEWYAKGILHVKDLLNHRGKPLPYKDFCNKYAFKCNFLHYFAIVKSIQTLLKGNHITNINLPPVMDINKLQSKRLYDLNIKSMTQKPSSLRYYCDKLSLVLPNSDWRKIFLLPRRTTLNNYLRELQLKINHHTYATDSFVSHFNKDINEKCKFCHERNDITHWFLECKKLKEFWKLFKKWILALFDYDLGENATTILFGTFNDEHLEVNFCILNAKLFIHNIRNRQRNCDDLYFSFTAFLCELKENLELEKRIFNIRNQNLDCHLKFPVLSENL